MLSMRWRNPNDGIVDSSVDSYHIEIPRILMPASLYSYFHWVILYYIYIHPNNFNPINKNLNIVDDKTRTEEAIGIQR